MLGYHGMVLLAWEPKLLRLEDSYFDQHFLINILCPDRNDSSKKKT